MTSGEDGPDINPSTFTADAVVSISWDANGILDNAHLEANVAVDLNSGDSMSISIEYDISQGIHTELGGTFDDTPPSPIGDEFVIPGFQVEVLGFAVSLGIAFMILKIRKSKR
ncbi:MAG: hypothetical protein KAR20_23900, partial [Candidatus Heimdallarchaeota archaeon]|nr:hypothetical protein [Candidatus Heimdallarchaeota archaeon]